MFGHVVHLVHFQQCDRLDRRPRQSALDIADDGPARFRVNRHTHDGVDHGESIGAGFYALSRIFSDVGLIRRQLGDQRLACHSATGGHYTR